MNRIIFVLLILLPILVVAQTEQKKDVWEPLRLLEGTWEREEPGVSKVHEDFGIFSYDQGRKTFVMRGFYVEGFVNTYVMDEISDDGKNFTFLSEHVENAPEGTEAKLVFKVISENEIEQSFHVSFPGREFSCLYINNLKKQK